MEKTLAILEIFHAQTLVTLQCGEVSAGKIHYHIQGGEIVDYDIRECKQLLSVIAERLLSVIAEMKYSQGSEFNFDHRMARKYLSCIKKAGHVGIWEQLCPETYALMVVKH